MFGSVLVVLSVSSKLNVMNTDDKSKEGQLKRKEKDMRQTQTPGIGKQPYDGSSSRERPSLDDKLPGLEDQHNK